MLNDTTTTKIYTLSLHDALPISKFDEPDVRCVRSALRHVRKRLRQRPRRQATPPAGRARARARRDRKSTRLNSSHTVISYAVFCLKKIRIQLSYGAFALNPHGLR